MNIKYKIVEVHDADRSFVVRYYTDIVTEEDLASFRDEDDKILRARSDVGITIYNHDATAEELEALIQAHAPKAWLEALEHAKLDKQSTALDHIKSKLHIEHEYTHQDPKTPKHPHADITAEHIDALIERLKNA